jgi:gliding motility-associated-like protein
MSLFKHLFNFLLLLLFVSNFSYAQAYILNKTFTSGQVITTLSGTFYDTGDSTQTYGLGEDYIVTFYPAKQGSLLQFNFNFVKINVGDTLFAYDGLSTSDALIGYLSFRYQANSLPTPQSGLQFAQSTIHASDTNSTGSITFRFKSDNVPNVSQATEQGWQGVIKLMPACKQRILGNISLLSNLNNCFTNFPTINFAASTNYPDNNTLYRQIDTSSWFHWNFGDGTDSLGKGLTNIVHTYNNRQSHEVQLTIIDSKQCINKLPIKAIVKISSDPIFKLAMPPNNCISDTVSAYPITDAVNMQNGTAITQQAPVRKILPVIKPGRLDACNGTGTTFYSRMLIDQFATGQTLTNINYLSILVNMEFYSLMHLSMELTAPNGTKVVLTNNFAGAPGATHPNTRLGEPVSNYTLRLVGKGYNYMFNNNPNKGTMASIYGTYTHTYIDNTGTTVTNAVYLPADSYTTTTPLSALIGTPLNGVWTLAVNDNYGFGSGYIFNWKLNFHPALLPPPQTYTVPISSQQWLQPATGLVATNGTTAIIVPPAAGNYNFTYRVVDSFGCTYDTVVNIVALAKPPKPILGSDVAICNTQPTATLNIANTQPNTTYTWSNGIVGNSITINTAGSYIATATNSLGCMAKDTIQVFSLTPIDVGLPATAAYCATGNNGVLQPNLLPNLPISYLWHTGATTPTLPITGAGTYWLQATATNGCRASDTTLVTNNPINAIAPWADTALCMGSSYIKNINLPVGGAILWGNGSTSSNQTITAPASYTALVSYAGCSKNLALTTTSKPIPIISLGNDETVCQGTPIIRSINYPNASYLWSTGSTDSTITLIKPNLYWAKATLNGCSYSDTMQLNNIICNCQTIVPNAFSPNADGVNDGFKPLMQCTAANVQDYSMAIYNRYGQQLFTTNTLSEAWKGTYNSSPLPVGTYYYIITYFNKGLQQPERFAGSITLLR